MLKYPQQVYIKVIVLLQQSHPLLLSLLPIVIQLLNRPPSNHLIVLPPQMTRQWAVLFHVLNYSVALLVLLTLCAVVTLHC
jgi:hypothetical protein